MKRSPRAFVVVDDSQRLGEAGLPLDARLPLVTEQLEDLAMKLDIPLLATWPDLEPGGAPQAWAERVAGASTIIAMGEDVERTKQFTEPKRAITLHVVKNRGGERASLNFDFSPARSKFAEQR